MTRLDWFVLGFSMGATAALEVRFWPSIEPRLLTLLGAR